MDSIQMNFWWGKKENEKGCYTKGWGDIALPKELGGLNIRRTDVLNMAFLTKLAWRLVENPDEPWAIILKEKYFANLNMLNDSISNNGSWMLEEWIRSRVNLSTQNHPTSRTTHSWLPPGNGILKINFDASHIDKNTLSGWGLICRNDAGITYGLRGVVKWTTNNFITDALSILKTLEFWVCSYAHRDANHLADSLAKFARSQFLCFRWFNNAPDWVQTLIQQDMNNV
ncbi:uncharacterized protein LOC113316485 [Papaver somniferum]|uniref:uncharacterized protein LOC113316485 n=1 Tax=Papaver somniferum TaxID=3469 RepID=UPI000E701046|nr:uncharacterized protein LOC113316485 [Papaver somniferum]